MTAGVGTARMPGFGAGRSVGVDTGVARPVAVTMPPTAAALKRARTELLHKRLMYAALIFTSMMFIFPFVWSLLTSFKTVQDAAVGAGLLPKTWTTSGYHTAVTQFPFPRYFLHSTLIALAITASNLVFCSMGGYAFARLKFPGRDAIFMLVLGTMRSWSGSNIAPSTSMKIASRPGNLSRAKA